MKAIAVPSGFNDWRNKARHLLSQQVSPAEVIWQRENEIGLPLDAFEVTLAASNEIKVSREFVDVAQVAACHRSGDQWALLYSILWRITQGEKHLIKVGTDPEVRRVRTMVKQVGRDCHKMHAFVRFREVGQDPETGRECFIAWYEPDHRIVRRNASFFRKRFTNMNWSILTPDECMHWDGDKIRFSEGVDKSRAPSGDAVEELWRSYYKSIFNVGRVKVKMMQSEMPKKFWKNLPEAEVIEGLLRGSSAKLGGMLETQPSPEKPAPKNAYLERLRDLPED